VILIIKLRNKKEISLNEFLNIKDIPKGKKYLYTFSNEVLLFIRVNPINIELLSEEELEAKMDLMSIEFANEQYPYKILVIPRTVDISEYIHEQGALKNKCEDSISRKIIEDRIKFTTNLVADKDIIENEFYIMIWEKDSENVETELNKRATNWVNKLKNCDLVSEILEEKEIILLVKSFTIPEFARTEGTDYADNIVKIKRKESNC